jgi:Leucine-rich repeat (LRR) protein
MIELASALTVPIAKLLLKSWLGDSVAVDIGDNLLKLGFKRFGDRGKAGAAQRQANRMAGAVVKDLEVFFTNERVDENALLPAAFELGETIRNNVDAAFLVHQSLSAEAIAKALIAARPVDKIYRRAEPEHAIYVRLVEVLAPRLRALAPELPDFARERDAVILQKLDEVADAAPKLLETLAGVHEKLDELIERPARLAQGFERDYLDAVVKELDYVEILGIEELDSKSRRADLTVAYLSLTARLGDGNEQQTIEFATLLTLLPLFGNRLWIEGGAGSGKSTLVRWAALEAARRRLGPASSADVLDVAPDLDRWLSFLRPDTSPEYENPFRTVAVHRFGASVANPFITAEKTVLREQAWRERLPFVVFLRFATDGVRLDQLPRVAVHTIGVPPEGWLQQAFSDAGAGTLLIFDGVDEVPVGRKREKILEQIGDFAERFPKAQVLVTSRPGAVEDGTLDGFQKVVLEDLSEPQKLRFIDHWHRALAANFKRKADDAVIAQLHQAALRELERQPTLGLLATNPLLCAAICAVHWLSRRKTVEEAWQSGTLSTASMQMGVLPASLWNLCEALTRMLVHQRDLDRELGGAAFGPAYCLTYEQKREILARIAYGMVAGELLSAMARGDVRAHVEAALAGFRDQPPVSAEEVLRALLERSGVLRGSGEDAVEFVHNTIKAFLAAKFYLGLLTPDEMVRRIAAGSPEELASGLDEIAIFGAASPDHPAYAQRLIEALLVSKPKARKLRILALRCEAAARSHLPQETRTRTRALAPKLFPPLDSHEARQLAALGEDAVAHLNYQPSMKAETSAAAVHCLRLIGTAKAHETMRAYLATESLVVAEELLHDYNPLEVRAVLKAVRNRRKWSTVPPAIRAAIRELAPLHRLTRLRAITLSETQVVDLSPIANLVDLRWLNLTQTKVTDVTPIANLRNISELYLGYTPISNISPLESLKNLRSLYLHGTRVKDISPLSRLSELEILTLGDSQVENILPLRRLTFLTRLNVDNLPITRLDWLSDHRRLQKLELGGTRVSELAPLTHLTNLESIALWRTQVANLAPLTSLSNLRALYLSATPVADVSPLADLIELEALDLSGTQVADIAALANLTKLRTLDLAGTRVADATPLLSLTKLRTLDLAGTRVADVTPLVNLTELRSLDLSGTLVSEDDVVELERALEERGNPLVIEGPEYRPVETEVEGQEW